MSLKVVVIAWLEFELVYYDVTPPTFFYGLELVVNSHFVSLFLSYHVTISDHQNTVTPVFVIRSRQAYLMAMLDQWECWQIIIDLECIFQELPTECYYHIHVKYKFTHEINH